MKLLLSSAGIKNAAIRERLDTMLGKPVSECHALAIPTAGYGHPMTDPTNAYSFISGHGSQTPMTELPWASVGVLELTALPSIGDDRWKTWVSAADVLLVNGGDALYLAHWIRESGLGGLLPSLQETVWVGLSAGSMVMTPRVGNAFVGWQPPAGGDQTLGLVDFSMFPHLENPDLPSNTLENARRWAATLDCPAYAIDDDTAISVVDGVVEVVSEGTWEFLPQTPTR